MPANHTFYDGSRMLEPMVNVFGFDTDKLNLLFCQLISVGIAGLYYFLCPPHRFKRFFRLLIPFVVGVALCYFCFGSAIKHIFWLISICYVLLLWAPAKHVHLAVFVYAMGYLVFIHWYRWYFLTNYTIDVTGPMMVMVQKAILLAFSLHDGRAERVEQLTETQRRESLSEVPSPLEYFSYMFQFQTVLTGPLNFYVDYMEFIRGENMHKHRRKSKTVAPTPKPFGPALVKISIACLCMALLYLFGASSDPKQIISPSAWALDWPRWLALFWFVIFMQRVQYYYAWSLADAICNLSGFGFNGFEDNGEPKWDLATNVDIWKVETALSFKETLDGWNIMTMYWLRKVAYDRFPKKYRTLATYSLSTIWHGFCMGYYLTFATGALITIGANMTRRCVRHHFQRNFWLARFYDVLTFLATKFALAYATFPFVTMHLNPGLNLYWRLNFFLHFLALFAVLALPRLFIAPKRKAENGAIVTLSPIAAMNSVGSFDRAKERFGHCTDVEKEVKSLMNGGCDLKTRAGGGSK